MTTTLISTNPQYTYGTLTNAATARLIALNAQIVRLHDAIETASAGYEGTPGTQFEIPNPVPLGPTGLASTMQPGQNLFGVQASSTPGEQGLAYAYAMGRLHEEWAKFWDAAHSYVEQLDNGASVI